MSSSSLARPRRLVLAALLPACLALTACGTATSSGRGGPPGADGTGDLPVVRFALDWTPNTNHTGLYVALEEGYFAEVGVDVEVLPYTDTPPDQLVDAGVAELGISAHDASVMAQTAGADVVAVLAPLQHWATAIGVRADDDSISRPRDLDGTTYAGFGAPYEEPVLRQVIRADGGTGDFTTVTLGSAAYDAVYTGRADFTIPFVAWEGIEAERAGHPLRYFRYTDYGFPDAYAVVVDADRRWAAQHPDLAAAVVGALRRGYELARDEPDAAARILVAANPGMFSDPDLVTASQRALAADLMTAPDGGVGSIDPDRWAGYADFLLDNGLLTDPAGDVVTERPDWSAFFTNEYLR